MKHLLILGFRKSNRSRFSPASYFILLVYGKIKTDNFISLKKIIDKSILNFEEISEIFYFSSGRWDIKTKNEILIKLPNKNLLESINFAIRLIQDETFKNNKVIDLRIDNYVISKK